MNYRNFKTIFFLTLAPILLFSCNPKVYQVAFKEADGYRPIDQYEWKLVPPGLNVSFGSINERYEKYGVPDLHPINKWSGFAWRGERVNVQALIWSAKELEGVRCIASDFLGDAGDKISAKSIKLFFVRYVITDEYGKGSGKRNASDHDSSLVADVLDPIRKMDTEAKTIRPIWVSIDIPPSTVTGNYTGKITIKANGYKNVDLEMNLKVSDKILSEPSQWTFHLDLWQNPYAVARFHNVELWSKEHYKLLEPLMKMLANSGQKCITVPIVEKPWGDNQAYDSFISTIKWIKTGDEIWKYDYSLFDRWVEFAMSHGIDRQINCYSMLPWGNQIAYYDESLNKDTIAIALPGTEQYKKLWMPFLKQFVIHLRNKGWLDKTVIAMDERKLEDMQKMIAFIKSVTPDLKIALAGGYHPEISNDIYDLCAYITNTIPLEALNQRQMTGLKSTFYVCCTPHHPNTFTFSPPSEATFLGWYAAANGYDGFLRWAYNSWVKNPLLDSRFRKWPAGDTFLIYPEASSSFRFEKLREGIQDYEKIRILRSELEAEKNSVAKEKLRQLDECLAMFRLKNLEQDQIDEMISKGKKLLEELSEN